MSSSISVPWLAASAEARPSAARAMARDARRDSEHSGVRSVRAQTAVVRALTDALQHHTAAGEAAESLRAQLVEELARLGLRLADGAPIGGSKAATR